MILSDKSWIAQRRLGRFAEEGRIRCDKCDRRLFSIFEICECGGKSVVKLDGVLMISDERKHEHDEGQVFLVS